MSEYSLEQIKHTIMDSSPITHGGGNCGLILIDEAGFCDRIRGEKGLWFVVY